MSARALGVGLFRLGLCALAALVIRYAGGGRAPRAGADALTLEEARAVFPAAAALGAELRELGAREVLDGGGKRLGSALRTSPETDELIGYSGPNDLLIGLGRDGRVVAVHLLESGDTRAHVDQVRAAAAYWRAFEGWDWLAPDELELDAVSGSTLTSLAIGEALERRLSGRVRSLRFPEPLRLAEALPSFPAAAQLVPEARGRARVHAAGGELLGFLLRSSPQADDVRGYRGPSEALVALAPDGIELLDVSLRASYDTPEYVERVRAAEDYLGRLAGHDAAAWAQLDFERAGLEGVSGATRTSFGLAEGLRRRFVADARGGAHGTSWSAGLRGLGHELALLTLLLGACAMTYGPWRGRRGLRLAWQVLLVGVLGLALGDLLSLALFAGWARGALPWSAAPALYLVGAVALLAPVAGRRQLYCHSLCPHGALQEWLGRIRRWRRSPPRAWHRRLRRLPWIALAAALAIAVLLPGFELARLEAFDAWVLGLVALCSAVLALVGLGACLFVPLAYCRYGCPTGALLELLRGPRAGLGRRDGVAAVLVVVLGALALARPEPSGAPHGPDALRIRGGGFGTSWSVELRGAPPAQERWRERVRAELARVERELSAWSPSSPLAQWNASATTLAVELPDELLDLVEFGLELSARTEGAFDFTVGPLVEAWGVGPAGPNAEAPSDGAPSDEAPRAGHLRELLQGVGWQKLELDREHGTLRKAHPDLRVDLGALLQGYAVDRVAALLDECGAFEYLIDVGGELRARGSWRVGVEDPRDGARELSRLVLRDGALATSGSYRLQHLISPRSGRPVASPWVLCSTRSKTALAADGWATALFVSGDAGPELALREGLPALFFDGGEELVNLGGF